MSRLKSCPSLLRYRPGHSQQFLFAEADFVIGIGMGELDFPF
jgi:hypothetical protein